MQRTANYKVMMVDNRNSTVVIRDVGPWDQFPTVTNRVEEVVQELFDLNALREGDRLLCFDSNGDLDEIVLKGRKFFGFRNAYSIDHRRYGGLKHLASA